MLALLVAGARVSLLIGFCAAAISALIGGTIGILSGFFGGKTDTALMRITDYFLVIPDVPLMIVIAALFGRSTWNIIVIIGIIYWTFTARLLRAQTKSVRERVYVQRARALGARNSRLDRAARAPAGDAAPRREHRPADRLRDLRRDLHHVPRPRGPEHDLVGPAHPERVHRRRDHQQRLVGDRSRRASA